jgi:NADPH:quinone reductase
VAGASSELVDGFLDRSQGDVIIDYRQEEPSISAAIKDAAKGAELLHAFDCVSGYGSFQTLSTVLSSSAKLRTILLFQDYSSIPSRLTHFEVDVLGYQKTWPEFSSVVFHYVARGLRQGWFEPHPFEVLEWGLDAVQDALAQTESRRSWRHQVRAVDFQGEPQPYLRSLA